ARAIATHLAGRVVAAPRLPERHGDIAYEVADPFGDLTDRRRFTRLEVVRAIRRDRFEGANVRSREVLDVHELPGLRTVAIDLDRLTAQRALEEGGDHEVAPHARAVRDAVAQHRVRAPVEIQVVAAEHLGR